MSTAITDDLNFIFDDGLKTITIILDNEKYVLPISEIKKILHKFKVEKKDDPKTI